MAHRSCRHFTSRGAIAAAERVGWSVRSKGSTGECEIIASDERRYLIRMPGRNGDDYIPVRLRRLLSAALIDRGE